MFQPQKLRSYQVLSLSSAERAASVGYQLLSVVSHFSKSLCRKKSWSMWPMMWRKLVIETIPELTKMAEIAKEVRHGGISL